MLEKMLSKCLKRPKNKEKREYENGSMEGMIRLIFVTFNLYEFVGTPEQPNLCKTAKKKVVFQILRTLG